KIWIENTLGSTAYATPFYDMANNFVSAGIGISRDFVENPKSINDWFSQKEGSSFGKNPDLFLYNTYHHKNFTSLHYALNHEFGHIFDYANRLNRYEGQCSLVSNPEECIPSIGSWGEISWKNGKTPKKEHDFFLRESLCFYQCGGGSMDPKDSSVVMDSLLLTNFQSTYASINPKEDWAEAFALYLGLKEANFSWEVSTQGKVYNLKKHFLSSKLKGKRDFLDKFFKGPIKYPASSN
ncbi:MAG: hypothetical protein K2Q18_11880, partial [Bdellovibrionales bacterium]|nr:hypothetical protein [Bdellovibrionales bacterium]